MSRTDDEIRALAIRKLALLVTRGELRRPWRVQTSCSFRRIGTDLVDGNVLCATARGPGGQPDLLAAPGVLDYLIAAQPQRVLEILDRRDRRWRVMAWLRCQIQGHDDAFREAEAIRLGDALSPPTVRKVVDLRALATRLDLACGGRPWIVQESDQTTRIGTDDASGEDDVVEDCIVLGAVAQLHDGQPDLRAQPGVLDYIVLAHPFVVTAIVEQCARAWHAIACLRHRVDGHDEAFREAEKESGCRHPA